MQDLPNNPRNSSHKANAAAKQAASLAKMHLVGVSAPTDKPIVARRRLDAIGAALSHAFFALLIVVDVVRTLRHAMWRDELLPFEIGLSSSSVAELISYLRYENYPALWYLLVWFITRVSSDPMWMQVLHIALALSVWFVVYFYSPFSRIEKILLLLSYFLFWEYFVISRCYVLIALIGFVFIALRERRPRPDYALWLLLGLLANVHMFGTIWSMALAAMLVIEYLPRRPVSIAGPALYLALLAIAIAVMLPAPEYSLSANDVHFSISRLNADLATPIGALVPLSPASIRDAIGLIAHPATAEIPKFWNATATGEIVALTQANTDHLFRLASVLAIPIVLCWMITRDRLLTLEFSTVYLGIVLFENIWNFPGGARHHGVVFLALIASAWSARLRRRPAIWSRWVFSAILVVNACGGVLTLASELRPFSEGYDTAAWIKQNDLENAFLVGSHNAQVWSVAGYLGRPIYYLECDCSSPAGIWSKQQVAKLSDKEFASRLAKAITLAANRDIILIRDRPVTAEDLKLISPSLSSTLLKSFTNASTDENFWIYRLSTQQAP